MTKGLFLAAMGAIAPGRIYRGRHFSSRAADCRVLLPLDFLQLDDPLPFCDLALDALAHLLGRGRAGSTAELGEPPPHLGELHDRTHFPVEPIDDRLRRAGGSREPEPGARLDPR